MSAWNDRTYLDDLREEWKDAREDERRKPSSHHESCRCRRCVVDEAKDEQP